MTDLEKNLLGDFKLKVKFLISQHEALKKEKRQLLEKISELESSVNILRQENKALDLKYENLKLARLMVASGNENKDAKGRIQKLVREIDKCIALLNK